jgi:hypothetical protein
VGDTTALASIVRDLLEAPVPVPREHPFALPKMLNATMGLYAELVECTLEE